MSSRVIAPDPGSVSGIPGSRQRRRCGRSWRRWWPRTAREPRIQELPAAAALLATTDAAKSGGALDALQDWAPAPLLQVPPHSHRPSAPALCRRQCLALVNIATAATCAVKGHAA